MMTPRQELLDAIARSPDELVRLLLDLLRVLQRQPNLAFSHAETQKTVDNKVIPERIHRKRGILVVETGHLDGLDINTLISDMREERINHQISQVNP